MTINEQFEKWAKEYVHKSPDISKREYGNDAYIGGYEQALIDALAETKIKRKVIKNWSKPKYLLDSIEVFLLEKKLELKHLNAELNTAEER